MSDLQRIIAKLAEDFASSVLKAISSSSLADISSLGSAPRAAAPKAIPATAKAKASPSARRAPKTRSRRTNADLDGVIDRVVASLSENGWMSSEQLQSALKLKKSDLGRPIKIALDRKLLRKRGVKRATVYSTT